jgi:hypothetical protein
VLQGADELSQWSAMQTNTADSSVSEFLPAVTTTSPQRFYRILAR